MLQLYGKSVSERVNKSVVGVWIYYIVVMNHFTLLKVCFARLGENVYDVMGP